MHNEITITLTWSEQQALWNAITWKEIENEKWIKECEKQETELEHRIYDASVTELASLIAIKERIKNA